MAHSLQSPLLVLLLPLVLVVVLLGLTLIVLLLLRPAVTGFLLHILKYLGSVQQIQQNLALNVPATLAQQKKMVNVKRH